jgi:hypothetical protein
MAPSKRRRLFFTVSIAALTAIACNGIVGLDEYKRAQCTDYDCGLFDGNFPDTFTPDVIRPDGSLPDGGEGTVAVSWAKWRMPNYTVPAEAGPSPPTAPILAVGAPGEVNDNVSTLVWKSALEKGGAPSTFEQAKGVCPSIEPKGAWRLPSRIELVTLLDYGHAKPFIDRTKFVGFPNSRVWSFSEERPLNTTKPRYWTVNFDSGAVELELGENQAAILCVKNK